MRTRRQGQDGRRSAWGACAKMKNVEGWRPAKGLGDVKGSNVRSGAEERRPVTCHGRQQGRGSLFDRRS